MLQEDVEPNLFRSPHPKGCVETWLVEVGLGYGAQPGELWYLRLGMDGGVEPGVVPTVSSS
jgi:hypothetical protein